MANTNVLTGGHGTLTLAPLDTPPGQDAESIIAAYEIQQAVGRVTGIRVCVETDLEEFHEIGFRHVTSLHEGNIHIHGTIDRAYINGALLNLLLGEAASSRPPASWAQPAFNITVLVDNPAMPGTRSSITLHEVKLDQWNYTMPEDDFVMEGASFQALYMTVEDEAA